MDETRVVERTRRRIDDAQFPRSCLGCGVRFATLGDLLLSVRQDPTAPTTGAGMPMPRCACGTTMVLDVPALSWPTRLALVAAARAEARRRSLPFGQVSSELHARVLARALTPPAAPDAQAWSGDVTELYDRTLARVTGNLRVVVTLLLLVATTLMMVRSSTMAALVAWAIVAAWSVALWSLRGRPRLATGLVVALLWLVLVTALLAFGPMAGSGALVATAILFVRTRFKRAVSLAAAVLAALTYAVVGAVAVRAGMTALPLIQWVRTGLVCGVISMFVALATGTLLDGLRHALAELEQLRRINERALAELARRRELETAGRLVGGVVHDVNNNLTVVDCCADELDREPLSASARELVSDIQITTKAAAGTMRALLDLVRPAPSEAARCDPAQVIAEVARNLERLLPDDVRLVTSLANGHTVALSRTGVLQATLNLVLNARDALEGQRERKEIQVAVEAAGDEIVVAVRDTGAGMDRATVSRLGEAFFSTKGSRGTGLGLSTVRATIEACGGRVLIESRPGVGTEIRLVLPQAPPLAEEVAPPAAQDLAGKRVLLAEDNDAIRRAFARAMSTLGASVTEAASVAQALRAIEAAGPFDVLVCDGILTDGTVDDLAAPFQGRFARAPIVLCTAHGVGAFAARGISLPHAKLIHKPISGMELARATAAAIARQPGAGPDVAGEAPATTPFSG